ncbi:hypothetical protein RJ640_003173 [Escallonia rubra]|uniref:Uncharacterized protein n=1 Tax=Escallonia rubra TaxID=112253 RepID=A0AA88RRM0_9ASTE|nr:hypothetical protein RJ640_003173 [Escallonia rubra]
MVAPIGAGGCQYSGVVAFPKGLPGNDSNGMAWRRLDSLGGADLAIVIRLRRLFQIQARSPSCVSWPMDSSLVHALIKGQWTDEEDRKLIRLVKKHGVTKWAQIAEKVIGRAGKQCRERLATIGLLANFAYTVSPGPSFASGRRYEGRESSIPRKMQNNGNHAVSQWDILLPAPNVWNDAKIQAVHVDVALISWQGQKLIFWSSAIAHSSVLVVVSVPAVNIS